MNSQAEIIWKQTSLLEKTVVFKSGDRRILGILSTPGDSQPAGACLISHGWAGNRNGPAGLLTNLARELTFCGNAVLRFDFGGRGESGGNGLESTLATMSEDLCAAADCLRKESSIEDISILGMCSGGNVAIGALPGLGNVSGMTLLSVYPFSDGDSFSRDINRTGHFISVYLRKACNPANWKRLITGEASISRVMKVIFRPFLKRGENAAKEGTARHTSGGTLVRASENESRNAPGTAPKKYLANFRKDMPVIMIYGTADPDAAAAMKYYGDYASEKKLPISFRQIDGANHNFSSHAWQKELQNIINQEH